MKVFFVTILLFVFAFCAYSQSNSRLQKRCEDDTYASILLAANDNIYTTPCVNHGIYTNNVLNPFYLQTQALFDNAANFTTNIINLPTSTSSLFRLGNKNNYLEQIQQNTGALNEIRIRTNETTPCCGGFAEIFLQSDTTHSYAYIRAQRNLQVRSDDFFVGNFLDNNKFRMRLQMDAIATHPLEDTSKFSVGNYTDRTNFIELENVTNKMLLQASKIAINPTGTIPPATATTCDIGQIYFDTGFLYICVATNTVKRVALASF